MSVISHSLSRSVINRRIWCRCCLYLILLQSAFIYSAKLLVFLSYVDSTHLVLMNWQIISSEKIFRSRHRNRLTWGKTSLAKSSCVGSIAIGLGIGWHVGVFLHFFYTKCSLKYCLFASLLTFVQSFARISTYQKS